MNSSPYVLIFWYSQKLDGFLLYSSCCIHHTGFHTVRLTVSYNGFGFNGLTSVTIESSKPLVLREVKRSSVGRCCLKLNYEIQTWRKLGAAKVARPREIKVQLWHLDFLSSHAFTMASAEIRKAKSKLKVLSSSLDELEAAIEPLFSGEQTLPEILLGLEPLQQAKLQTVLPYLVYDLVFSTCPNHFLFNWSLNFCVYKVYLRTRGIDPKSHPVVTELVRLWFLQT